MAVFRIRKAGGGSTVRGGDTLQAVSATQTIDGVLFDFTGGVFGPISPVTRITIQ